VRPRLFRVNSVLLTGLVLALGGCQSMPKLTDRVEVDSSEEAANIFVSAYPAVPWANISAKLAPSNNLTIDQARTLAAVITQTDESQALSYFAAGLAVGLPGTSSVTTTTLANGATQTTGTRTSSTGTAPTSSGSASTVLPNGPTPDLTKGPLAMGIDGTTQLINGTGLYQLAQILDNQIANEVLPDGYRAYLLTFQVNLQPLRRNLAYDAYTDISLFPANWGEAVSTSASTDHDSGQLPAVKLYPLIIADAMETTNVGRSVQALRQASLQLSGIVSGFGINASGGGGSNNYNSIVALDKNSLVTAGRVNDNTLRVRLGAENSGSSGLAMVPRSYNVSIVVMTRWDQVSAISRVTRLSVVTHTTIVNDQGKVLGSGAARRRSELAFNVARTVKDFAYPTIGDRCGSSISLSTDLEKSRSEPYTTTALNLLRALDRGDYTMVQKCLSLQATLVVNEDIALQRLLAALEEVQVSARYANFLIALQDSAPKIPDPDQLVLFSDDGKQTASVVVRGGGGLDAKQLQAALFLADNRKRLLPTAITMTGDGNEITITFPSLAKLGLDIEKDLAKDNPLHLAIDRAADLTKRDATKIAFYGIRLVPTDAAKTSNPVQATQTVLVADASGTDTVTLLVAKTAPAGAHLMASGGNFRTAAGSVTPTASGIALPVGGGVVTITLGDLTPARLVTVTTMDANNKPIGDPISFTVDRAAPK